MSIVWVQASNRRHRPARPRKADVIDGQQRLTTLSLLFAALANQVKGQLKQNLEGKLPEEGNTLSGALAQPRLKLRPRDQGFYETNVLGLRFEQLYAMNPGRLPSEAQRNLRDNALRFDTLVRQHFSSQEEL